MSFAQTVAIHENSIYNIRGCKSLCSFYTLIISMQRPVMSQKLVIHIADIQRTIYFQFIIAAFVTKFTRTLTKARERRWIHGFNTMSMSKTQKVRTTFGIRMVGRMRWDFQLLSMPEIYQWVSSCDFRFLQINIEYKEHPVSQLCNTGAV